MSLNRVTFSQHLADDHIKENATSSVKSMVNDNVTENIWINIVLNVRINIKNHIRDWTGTNMELDQAYSKVTL